MKHTSTLYGTARCVNPRCGFVFGLPDEESRNKCQEKNIRCPICGNKLEVEA